MSSTPRDVFRHEQCRLCRHHIQGARFEQRNGITKRPRFCLSYWPSCLQCSWQGPFYRNGQVRNFRSEDDFDRDHYLFEGCFEGHWYVCTLGQGWSPLAFDEDACYVCRESAATCYVCRDLIGTLAKAFAFVRGAALCASPLRQVPRCSLVQSIFELFVLHPALRERVRRMYVPKWYSSPVLQQRARFDGV